MATVDSFIPDIIQNTFFSGYTIFNTIIYTLILIVFFIIILKIFEKLNINPISIIFSIIPFVFLGSYIRALVDNGFYPKTVFLITPGLYILVGLITTFIFLFSIFIFNKKGIDYRYTLFFIGIILLIIFLFLSKFILISNLNIIPILYILITWITSSFLMFLLFFIIPIIKDKINFSILSAHLFDASSTFIGVEFFNYSEQHVLSNILYQQFGTSLTMFPMKIIIILSVLWTIDKYIDNETEKNLLKLTIFILGLAPGLRNFLTLVIGTF